jgi:excisionase family DNA binding protein
MLTVPEVAKRLKVSVRLVYKLVEKGDISSYRIASAIRVTEEDLQAYLSEVRVGKRTRQVTLRRLSV